MTAFTPALRSAFEPHLRGPLDPGTSTPIQRAIAFLRSKGTDAHVWLPGVGSVNGLTAGNYLLSDTSTGLTTQDDKVGRGRDAMGSMGPELVDSANSASAWVAYGTNTVAQDGDAVKVTFSSTSGGAYLNLSQAGGLNSNLVLNNTYTISVQLKINFGSANFAIYDTSLGAYIDSTAISSANYVTRSFIFSHAGGVPYIQFANMGSGEIVWIRNISVSKYTGIDATQSTSANQPVLRKGPVNLLTYSQDFTNAAWGTIRATITPVSITALETSSSGFVITRAATTITLTTATYAFEIKRGSSAYACLVLYDGVANGIRQAFNLDTVAVTSSNSFGTGWSKVSASITPGADGYCICLVTVSKTGYAVAVSMYPSILGDLNFTCTVGDVGYIKAAALMQGTLTASQIISPGGITPTTSKALSSGVGPQYWEFGGDGLVTDYLTLSAVPFQMSDPHCVVVAARNQKASGAGIVFALAGATTQRVAQIYYSDAAPATSWIDDAGTGSAAHTGAIQPINSTQVISARRNGNVFTSRINGVSFGSTTIATGATTIDSQSIGAHKATPANYHQGNIYIVIAIKGTVSDADLLLLEKLAASLAGIQI